MKIALLAATTAVCSFAFVSTVFADLETANKYLDDATTLVSKGPQFFEDATGKLELAEASLDDVTPEQKANVKTKIDALKAKITETSAAGDKERIERDTKAQMDRLSEVVGNLAAWPSMAQGMEEQLKDPKTTAALGADEVAKLNKQYQTMLKLHQSKALKENLAHAKEQVDELEKFWNEKKPEITDKDATPEGRRDDVGKAESEFEAIERFFKDLPADNADVKAQHDRVDKLTADFNAVRGNAGSLEVVADINRFMELYENEFAGMDAEKGEVTWADFKASKGDAREFNLKQTGNYLRRVPGWSAEFVARENYKAAKDAPEVKAKVAEINAKLATARTKTLKAVNSLVAEFEKEGANANNVSDGYSLTSQTKFFLGENDAEGKALIARVDQKFADQRAAGDKADADKDAYYKKMSEQAAKAWPDMMAKFDVTEGFDPNNYKDFKGKYIKITTDNLMGWHFKPGDFPWATTLNGKPVAGKYDPAVAAALAEVEGKIGRSIGDSDDDGKWICICKVEGSTGTLYQKQEVTGGLTDQSGSNAGSWTGTQVTPVESPIVTIVALKAGPVAAAAGQGTVKEDGSIGKSAAPAAGSALAAGSTGGGHGFLFLPFIMGLFSIVVGAACLMKAKFAPLAGNAGAAQFAEKVGGQNLAYLGLAGIALGALGLLMNLIYLFSAPLVALIGLVASVAMIVAGAVAARDIFDERKILPPTVGPMLSQYAIPAGLACAALGLLTMITAI